MKFNNVVISDFAHYLPEKVMSSDEIEKRLAPLYKKLRLPEGRLELMTGITERRYWEPGTRPSALSTKAANNLFDSGKLKKEDIDLVIHASVCRDFLEPSTASVVHCDLGLKPEAMLFDLSNACLGVMSSMVMAANLIESGAIKHALIVSGENGGPLLFQTIETLLKDDSINRKNIKKYIANLTIGSAAVAYTLSHKDLASGHKLVGGVSMADTSANVLCQGGGDTQALMMETDSEELMKKGVVLAKETWERTKAELAWENSDIDWAIGHQVGKAHEALTMETLGLENKQTFKTYPFLGNTGSAALPVTLDLLNHEMKIEKGSKVALLGIGSGLNSIMLGVEW
ncbi:MAG: 3-oxoacyl-ACP synthase III [Halobacteriovorax sp.]|nr:3-oxoacyl-ACP synthase III [Halobacteriovorax sp.]|tara:strand:+ start:30162 stop:31190 length:1029 start_codon:yes stop_codon:yes gene_type:complete